ncbi:phosphatidylinositol N-acetylglucosaminyltransferase subunit Q, partial [Tremellales sp. Uapishka_1]
MRVFWPKTGVQGATGTIVGWRIGPVICVVDIVPQSQWIDGEGVYKLERLGRAVAHWTDPPVSDLELIVRKGAVVKSNQLVDIVLFVPPDERRLRYLRLSGDAQRICKGDRKLCSVGVRASKRADGIEDLLPLINGVKKAQRYLPHPTVGTSKTAESALADLAGFVLLPLHFAALSMLAVIDRPRSRKVSVTIDQICLRTDQFLTIPSRFRTTLEKGQPMVRRSGLYIKYVFSLTGVNGPGLTLGRARFWNTVWLIINDLILGYTIRSILLQFSPVLESSLPKVFRDYIVHAPITILHWLNDWPVGLKLNTPLSSFFANALTLLSSHWGDLLQPILGIATPILLRILAFSSLGGATLFLSLLQDLLSLLTLNIDLSYRLTATVCKFQLDNLSGLFNLFRGKRWNVLRSRTDSYDYDLDQLFLGTLLFTVSAFLFPTVLTYAALFFLLRNLIRAIARCLDIARKALNGFPLFELMLRLKEPSRVPSGIYFDLRPPPPRASRIHSLAELKNSPSALREIFANA